MSDRFTDIVCDLEDIETPGARLARELAQLVKEQLKDKTKDMVFTPGTYESSYPWPIASGVLPDGTLDMNLASGVIWLNPTIQTSGLSYITLEWKIDSSEK